MPFVEISLHGHKTNISYFKHGGNREALIYLHAGACSKEDFRGALETNLSAHTIVSIDFPGCGESPYDENFPIGVDELVEIVHQIVQKLHLEKITIVGHSIGGLVGLLYAKKYSNVSSFINIEGNLAPENCLFSKKVSDVSFEGFKHKIYPQLINDLDGSENIGFRHWGNRLKASNKKAFYDCCSSLVRYSCNGTLIHDYTNLKIPTLYVYGSETKDGLSFLPRLEREGSSVAEIPASNHFPLYDNPKIMYEIIEDFVRNKKRST